MANRRAPTRGFERRKRVWARNQGAMLDVGQAGLAEPLSTSFITNMGTAHLPVGLTISGVLLDLTVSRATIGTDATSSQLQIGIICQDESVLAEVQQPLTDVHADWMWWQQISFPDVAAGTTVSTFASMGGPLRIRAKRKCEELGMNLFLVAQGYDIAPTFDITYASSTLMLLL